MTTLPKDYVVLGHIKDINVPKSWETRKGINYDDHLHGWAWRYATGNIYWNVVNIGGWVEKTSDLIIAALIGSPLYNMNKKKTRPTVKQVKELNHKILDLERDKIVLEMENNKLREQLAAIGKIIKGG